MISKTGAIVSLIFAATLLAANSWLSHSLNQPVEAVVDLDTFPLELESWTGVEGRGLNIRAVDTLQLDQYLRRSYKRGPKETIQLYIGYWDKQSGDYQAAKHSPAVCLPANGWSVENVSQMHWGNNSKLPFKELSAKYRSQGQLFRYWFFSSSHNYSAEWKALLTIGLDGLTKGRTDGGIIEVSTPIRTDLFGDKAKENAASLLDDFMRQLYPEVQRIKAGI